VLYQNDNKTKPDIGNKYQCLAQRNPKVSLNTSSSFSASTPKQLHYQTLHSFVIISTPLWSGNQSHWYEELERIISCTLLYRCNIIKQGQRVGTC